VRQSIQHGNLGPEYAALVSCIPPQLYAWELSRLSQSDFAAILDEKLRILARIDAQNAAVLRARSNSLYEDLLALDDLPRVRISRQLMVLAPCSSRNSARGMRGI